MNLEETRRYIERRMGDVGLSVRIDNSGYQAIQKYTSGDKERLNQLYYKLVSVGSRQEKREVNGVTIQIAIDDLRRMDEFMDHMPVRLDHNAKVDVDRLTIEQLASSLEQKVAEQIEFAVEEVRRKGPTATSEAGGANGTDHLAVAEGQLKTAIAPVSGVTTAGTPGKPCILVVDDSPTIRAAVTKALENDFELIQAPDGEKGWEALCANSSIKLVVTDLMMPGIDGFALIERIRLAKVPGIAGLPIIVVTALEDPQAKVHALVAGANDFITKRTDTLELQARVVARYQLSQIVGNPEYSGGSRPQKESGPPPHEIAAALLGTRRSSAIGRQSVNIANAAKRYGKTNQDSAQGVAALSDSVDRDGSTRLDYEQNGNRSWVRAIGLNRLVQMSSTTGITLSASVLVVAVILGVLYANHSFNQIAVVLKPRSFEPEIRDSLSLPTNVSPPVVAGDPPAVSSEEKSESAENAGSWTTVDGSPAREKLAPTTDIGTAPPVAKESVQLPKKTAAATVKEEASFRREAKPAVTVAQVLPKASKEPPTSSGSKSNSTSARNEVPAARAASTELDRVEKRSAAPGTATAASELVTAESAKTVEATPAATGAQFDLRESPPQAAMSPVESNQNSIDNTPDTLVATVGPPRAGSVTAPNTRLTKSELTSLINRFVFVYQAGDIQQFLSLFDDNIRTNDRTTKAGLRQDYEDLFRNTSMRQMVLGDVSWDIKDRQAEGAANFEVRIRRVNEPEVRVYQGSLTFHVEKSDGRVRINRMYHGQWKTQG